eukprot:1159810-Pelagomonas_calceolata.AAC.18
MPCVHKKLPCVHKESFLIQQFMMHLRDLCCVLGPSWQGKQRDHGVLETNAVEENTRPPYHAGKEILELPICEWICTWRRLLRPDPQP